MLKSDIRLLNNELAQLAKELTLLNTKTIADFKDEISKRRSDAFACELAQLAKENEGDIDALIGADIDDLVISEEDIFNNILDEKASGYEMAIESVRMRAFHAMDCHSVKVSFKNNKLLFTVGNFESRDYSKAKKHYLKRENRRGYYPMVSKDRETFLKQRALLGAILDTDSSINTVSILAKYTFLDETLKDTVARLYYTLLSEQDVYLYKGEEINRSIAFLKVA